jgi:DNA (cytosine-5)-methyltransferase 1
MLNVLSMFSGVGGFDIGLENAGMKTVFQCEIDKHCRKVLDRHWPDVPKWDDIQTLTGKYVLEKAGAVDVVAWGSPCQDLSVAGKRAGLAGESSGLFHEGIRIIKEMREESNGQYPRISIWENVMGSLSSNGGADFGRVIDEMAEAGALVIEWRCLDARFFNVAQRRRRVFVLAVFDSSVSDNCPDPILPVTSGVSWHPKTSRAAREGIANETHGSSVETNTRPIYLDRAACQQGINAQFDTYISDAPQIPTLTAQGPGAVATERTIIAFSHTQGLDAQPSEKHWPTLRTEGQGHAVYQEPLVYDGYNQNLSETGIHQSLRIGRDSSDFIAQSLEENKVEEVSGELAIRRLTPLECERLMGWPDNWTEGQTDGHRYRQCGNGIASPVAEWIGEQVIKIWEPHESVEH